MQSKLPKSVFPSITLFLAAMSVPVRLVAQEQTKQHHHYKVIDLGTFGGPNSGFQENFLDFAGGATVQVLSNQGTTIANADTSTPDPIPDFFDDGSVVSIAPSPLLLSS